MKRIYYSTYYPLKNSCSLLKKKKKKSRVWRGEKRNLNYLRDGNDSWSLSNSEQPFSRSGDVYISRLNREEKRKKERVPCRSGPSMGGYRASLWQRRISSSPAERERLLERDDDAFEAPSPLSFSKRLINEVGRLVQVVYPLLNRYVPRYRPIPPPRTAGVQLFKYALIICV